MFLASIGANFYIFSYELWLKSVYNFWISVGLLSTFEFFRLSISPNIFTFLAEITFCDILNGLISLDPFLVVYDFLNPVSIP